MAATAAQIDANRTNSESSTGPKTEEGKTRSRENALKHGLASGRLFIEGENREEFYELKRALRQEHKPRGITEDLLIEKMALSFWLSRRAIVWQGASIDTEPGAPPQNLAMLIRYQTANDRAFYKALETLRALQKERKQQEAAAQRDAQIGFVLNASDEEFFDQSIKAYNQRNPSEPFPELTPEEKQDLLATYRENTPESTARRHQIIETAGLRCAVAA